MGGFAIVLFIVFAIAIVFLQRAGHERKIHDQIESMGGTVLSIEHKTFDRGPFHLIGKGQMVYKIGYRIDDEFREGWVKFGSIFGPDWRL